MKKILLVFSIMFLFLTSGCSDNINNDETDINKDILNNVLKNKQTFIKENGKEVYLNNYIINENNRIEPIVAKPYEYVFVDFDLDGKEELVIDISQDYGYYIVLHYNGKEVYSYEFVIRTLLSLKKDGSFIGSNGAASNYYCRLSFENNQKNIKYEAIKDSVLGIFELNGKNVSIEEINEFINDWYLKENVKWEKMK